MIEEITVKLVQTEEELQDAFFVRHEVFVKEQGVPQPLEQDEYDAVSKHIVVYFKNNPIAAGRVRIIDEHVAKVDRVCVLPEFRRQQIGIRMMQKLEEFAQLSEKANGIEVIKIHAQIHAVPFYEILNYKITSPEFIDGGVAFRAMEKVFN